MVVTKRQRMMLIALGVVAAGYVVDQALLQPQPAAASAQPAAAPTQDATKQPLAVPVVAQEPQGPSLSSRLRSAASQALAGTLRDAFYGPPADGAAEIDHAAVAAASAADEFQRSHRLTAIMGVGESGVIRINGQTLKTGGEIDGFRLIGVDREGATFVSKGVEVRLVAASLESAPVGPPAPSHRSR